MHISQVNLVLLPPWEEVRKFLYFIFYVFLYLLCLIILSVFTCSALLFFITKLLFLKFFYEKLYFPVEEMPLDITSNIEQNNVLSNSPFFWLW